MKARQLAHVVIPVYGRPDMLARNLDFLSQTSIYEQKITVIDDASDPSDSEAISRVVKEHPAVTLLRNLTNLGFGQTVNSVLMSSDLEFSMVLNSDIVFMKFDVLRQVRFMRKHQNLAAIGFTTSKGNFNRVTWGLPLNSGLEALTLSIESIGKNILNRIYVLDAGAIFLRTSCFQQVGGFDKTYGRGYGEDVDLGYKFIEEGFSLACDCGTFYHHTGGASFGHEKKDLLALGKSRLRDRWGKIGQGFEKHSIRSPHAPYVQDDFPSEFNPLPSEIKNQLDRDPL